MGSNHTKRKLIAEKRTLVSEIENKTGGNCVGIIGHVAMFYRQQPDPGSGFVIFLSIKPILVSHKMHNVISIEISAGT